MPGATLAYHIVLRPTHPHEAALIDALIGLPTGRRAQRIRQLLLRGIDLPQLAVPWRDKTKRALFADQARRMRIAVYVNSTAIEDAPLRVAIAQVYPDYVGDYLKEALATGLLTPDAASVPAPAPPPVTMAPAAIPAPPAIAPAPAVHIDFVIDEPAPAQEHAPAMEAPPDEAPPMLGNPSKKRPELMKLMMGA